MKSVLFLIAFSLVNVVRGRVHGPRHGLEARTVGGYYQEPSGKATFTAYTGNCEIRIACGIVANGYTAAMSQRSFGAGGNEGSGDACGRCFKITGTEDPYSPDSKGPFTSIIVMVNNLCPYQEGENWCGQSNSTPVNQYGAPVHFDLCEDSGSARAFFQGTTIGALSGNYEEVSCKYWSGWNGDPLWNNACLKGENVGLWPHHTGLNELGNTKMSHCSTK